MIKKILTSAFAIIMIAGIGTSPVNSNSSNTFEKVYASDNISYYTDELDYSILNDGTVCITQYYGGDKTYYTIPAYLSGKPVTQIAGLTFYSHPSLKKVTFPNSLKKIGREAFWNCSGLTSITFPDSLTTIDERAFLNCTGLTSVTLSDSITEIADDAFDGCSKDLVFYVNKGTYAEIYVRYMQLNFKLLNHDHEYNDNIIFEPTCEENGLVVHSCVEGDDEYEEVLPALGHNYTEIEHEATCTNRGFTEHICTRCGKSYNDNYTPVKPHTYVDRDIEPSCTEKGYTEHICEECGISYIDSYIDSLGHDFYSEISKEPTCTTEGTRTYSCYRCGYTYTEKIAKTAHKYTTKTVAPTYTAQGYTLHTCSVCGDSYKDNYKAKLTKPSLAKSTVTGIANKYYTGKAITQSPTVKLGNKTLKKGTDYTVTFKNNKAVGKATVTIKGKGNYSGTVTKTFKILPKKTTLKTAASPKKGQLKVTYSKQTNITGYQITYSTSKSFKSKASKASAKTSKTISGLKSGKTYYVKVRTYKTVGGTKYYSGYSAVKKIKVK